MSRKTVKRWLAVAAALVAAGVVLRLTGLAGTLLTPLQTGVAGAAEWLIERTDIGGYKAKYHAAQEQLATLREQLAAEQEAVHTAAFYRAFLELKTKRCDFVLCDARVIAAGRDTLTVNVGTLDAVAVGQPVLTAAGLYGTVAGVGLNWAQIRPLSSDDVSVSVVCCRTGETAQLINGTVHLDRDSTVTAGDLVITSGYGGAFPRGLLVGEIGAVTADSGGLSRTAAVRVFAEDAERVMVLVGF